MEVRVILKSLSVQVRRIEIDDSLGRPIVARVDFAVHEPLDPEELIGAPARIDVVADDGTMIARHGITARLTLRATTRADAERVGSVEIRSAIELLEHRRTSRVFREKNAVAVVRELLAGVGIVGKAFATEIADPPPVVPYLTQWSETDARFLSRVCEEAGLYFRWEAADGFDRFILCDRSADAPAALTEPLMFVDAAALRASDAVAFHPRLRRRRRPGKVTLRDFDPSRPTLRLEAVAENGKGVEKKVEVYRAPGRFATDADGARNSRIELEGLRADTTVLEFQSRAFALAAGTSFEARGDARHAPSGQFFVESTRFEWEAGHPIRAGEGGSLHVTAIPIATPFRLPQRTPRPKIPGILGGTVTGRSGEEIHADGAARVKVSFPWEREAPQDETASLPVRVMQPNMSGSMMIPRVGWEVLVGFEEGDPDRPVILGRSFNGKQRPPFALPANKTMTAIGSVSSPGAGRANMISFDDAAGRQHMVWNAGFGKTTEVGRHMSNQTVGFEQSHVKGSQDWDIRGTETISVENAWAVSVGSQTAKVGGDQKLTLKATATRIVGSEKVAIGAALIEKVGNPHDGFANFAKAAVISGVSQIPVVGPVLTKAYTWGDALYQGYKKGGLDGLAMAAGQTVVGEVAGQFGGADSLVAAADGAGFTPWSEKSRERASAQEAGGGGSGAAAVGAGAAAAAPGHRKVYIDGTATEVIGGIHAIQTPGSLKWTTLGAGTFDITGSHVTSAVRISRLSTARASDRAASMRITTKKAIGRNVKTAHSVRAGTITLDATGELGFKAKGSMKVDVDGSAKFEGGTVVFECGSSSVSIDSGGIAMTSSSITIDGKTHHTGKEHIG